MSIKGITVDLGTADALVDVAAKIEADHPGHLVLVQAGKFLQGYNRTAFALHVIKHYTLRLRGPTKSPHLMAGFPVSNFKRRLWPIVDQLGIPYVVATGTLQDGFEIYINADHTGNESILFTITDDVVYEAIDGLRQQKQLNISATQKMLANPDTTEFMLKSKAQALDTMLAGDLIKLSRELRATWGENVRETMARIMRGTFLYGNEDNKPRLLKQISADVDLIKYYLTQTQRLSRFKIAFEHRADLAVELGCIVGGLMRARNARP